MKFGGKDQGAERLKRFARQTLIAALLPAALAPRPAIRGAAPVAPVRFNAPANALTARESGAYTRIPLPAPPEVLLEVTGILPEADHTILVTTRHGEIWKIAGAYEAVPHPKYTLFAGGLHEPLGIVRAARGGYYVAQREEVTLLSDPSHCGSATHFETVVRFPVDGNYHEYAYGPVVAPNGDMRIALNVAFGAKTQSPVPWRGWMMQVMPDGKLKPIAAGLRSPNGFIVNSHGDWLYSENQGEWVGAGKVSEINAGDFFGHPASLAWSKLPGSPIKATIADIPDDDEPLHEAAKKVPGGIKLPAVWFPYAIMGISTAGLAENGPGGRFGPFPGQYFVGDQGQSKVMRMTLERVNGVLQGACYDFLSGFQSGVIRLNWGEDGSLLVGETNRGWGSVGEKKEGFERVVWNGTVPFEIKDIAAQPDGFLLHFTQPVDPLLAAKTSSYAITSFTYRYHHIYGSPIINAAPAPVLKAVVADDRMSVRLAVACLRQYYIHEIKAPGVRSAAVETLVHDTAYYTLNQIPVGPRLAPAQALDELCAATAVTAAAMGPSPKHPDGLPDGWGGAAEHVYTLETKSGLKFEPNELSVTAGAHVCIVLHNGDDMLHNFVLTKPGKGQTVGALSLSLGIDGPAKNYVPDTDDVLFYTRLLQPNGSDAIYFTAPAEPGSYDFICSFPGHYALMHGQLRVTPK
jgi:azurin/glucose/arabinose dehydrogenase